MAKTFKNLEEYIELTKQVVIANRNKGNRYSEILSSLYADPVHFLDEILQNAEDACARIETLGYIKINFDVNGIAIYHNGDPFNEADLIAITTYGKTTKKQLSNINKIGKFGIGFRSVFGITDRPEIHSGEYHFAITDFELLEHIEPKAIPVGYTTYFWFPFKKNISSRVLWDDVRLWDHRFILFLNYIYKVELVNQPNNENYFIEKIITDDDKIIVIKSNLPECLSEENYLLISKNNNKQKRLSIAMSLDKNETRNPLFVFFPTKETLNLPFLVHGFFTTTPTREQIPWDNKAVKENQILLKQLNNLFKNFLKELRKRALLTPKLYEAFTLTNHTHPIEKLWTEQWIDFLKIDRSILTKEKKYLPPALTALPKHKSLVELIPANALNKLWNKKAWIEPSILDYPNITELIKKELYIRIIDERDFGYAVKELNLNKRYKLKQIELFYSLLAEHPELVLPINKDKFYSLTDFAWLYTEDKKWLCHNDQLSNIYLSGAPDPSQNINPIFLKQEKIVNFLYSLQIKPYEIADGVNNQLTALMQKKAYRKLWKLMLENIDNIDFELIANFSCFPNLKKEWKKADEVYLPTKELEYYFSYHVDFIDCKWFERNFKLPFSQLQYITKKIGVCKFPKKIKIDKKLTEEEKISLRRNTEVKPIIEEKIIDWNIEGLDEFIENINFEKSNFLFHWILQFPDDYWWGQYTWASYIREDRAIFRSMAWHTLYKNAWIYDDNNHLMPTAEIDLSKIKSEYNLSANEIKNFINLFELTHYDDFGLSLDEYKLIQLYRDGTLGIEGMLNGSFAYPKKNIHYFNLKELKNKGIITNSLKILEEFTPDFPINIFPFVQIKKPFEKMFSNLLDIAYEWIMQQILANNENYKIKKSNEGYIDLLKSNFVMKRYYVGGREYSNDYFMIYKSVLEPNINIPASLILIDLSDNENILLIEIEDYEQFIGNNMINPEIIFLLW